MPKASTTAGSDCIKWHPGHYLFTAHVRTYDSLWTNETIKKNFLGIQMKFDWGPMENQKDAYDFSQIDNVLAYMQKMNAKYNTTKRLVIQMGDKIFNGGSTYEGPAYMSFDQGNTYEGGYFQADTRGGWAVKNWVPAVNDRWQKLIMQLGNRYDANPLVEGIVFSETIVHKGTGVDAGRKGGRKNNINMNQDDDGGDVSGGGDPHTSYSGALSNSGYDVNQYEQIIKSNLAVAKKAFPHTVIIQYMNKFTGNDGRPATNSPALLEDLANYAAQIGVGVGGPDLQAPGREGQHSQAFPAFQAHAGQIPLGVAAQGSEYEQEAYTAQKLFDFGVGGNQQSYSDDITLHLNYIFWTVEDNHTVVHFTTDVVPVVNAENARINSAFPKALASDASPCTE